MDDHLQGPPARSAAVAPSAPQQILVCTPCRHTGEPCGQGFQLLKALRAAVSAAGLGEPFEISGTAALARCVAAQGQPCIVGWRATKTAAWLFGDIDPDQPMDDLVAFACAHAARDDRGPYGRDLSPVACDRTLARLPAAMIVMREGAIQ